METQQTPPQAVNPPPPKPIGGSSSGSIVDSLIGGDRKGIGGALCNDPNGMCLSSLGTTVDPSKSGVYTSIARMAAMLEGSRGGDTPLICIETDKAAVLVKEYHGGHTVALRVPVSNREGTGAEDSVEDPNGGRMKSLDI
uniref:Late endosomal/lysosomal adaptor and MAPK and MTOR activator 5 n=1 Tax=Attheya septentrionalis TaxID=420275 RepID=A0A7S2UDJ8_9STRA|mmetsp:Transcript_21165/g.38194  ORF Transcript_21165/g.38194 Transcript_21165/m.38194 type:complete len:140 (+) Transcript_21165:21-440(+)